MFERNAHLDRVNFEMRKTSTYQNSNRRGWLNRWDARWAVSRAVHRSCILGVSKMLNTPTTTSAIKEERTPVQFRASGAEIASPSIRNSNRPSVILQPEHRLNKRRRHERGGFEFCSSNSYSSFELETPWHYTFELRAP